MKIYALWGVSSGKKKSEIVQAPLVQIGQLQFPDAGESLKKETRLGRKPTKS
jgi:hypothetical protein